MMAAEIPAMMSFFQKQNFVRRFRKGQLICAQGEPFNYVYMMNGGMVKSYDIDEGGSERTIAIFARKTIFPLTWLMDEPLAQHIYFYEAFTDASCYIAHKDEVRRFITEKPQVLRGVMGALTKSYINLAGRLRNLERSHVHERLEFVLYVLAQDLGSLQGSIARIDTVITQEDISRMAGVTRESISIELNEARARRLMWKEGHETYIDLAKLDTRTMPPFLGGDAQELRA